MFELHGNSLWSRAADPYKGAFFVCATQRLLFYNGNPRKRVHTCTAFTGNHSIV